MNYKERIYEALVNEMEAGKPAGRRPRLPHPYGAAADVSHGRDVATMEKYLTRKGRKETQARLQSKAAESPLTRPSQRRLTRIGAALRSVVGRNK